MVAQRESTKTLFPRDSKAMTMNVGIHFGACNNPPADLLHCECTQHPVIPHHHNQHPPITKNVQQNRAKMG